MSAEPLMTSLALTSPNGMMNNHSNAQLAHLLQNSYCDNDRLTKELGNTKNELKKVERLLAEFQAATVNGAPLSGKARRVIKEVEARVAHASRQRDEAEARRCVLESYRELVLSLVSTQNQHDHSPYSANPSITVKPPPRSHIRSHHSYTSSSLSSAALSPGPLAPPSTRGVRPRLGSFDEPSYLIAQPQSPSKRPRNERGEYDHRPCLPAGELGTYQTYTTLPACLRSLLYKLQATASFHSDPNSNPDVELGEAADAVADHHSASLTGIKEDMEVGQ